MKEINLREFYPEIYKTDSFLLIMGMILNAKLFFLPQRCRRS